MAAARVRVILDTRRWYSGLLFRPLVFGVSYAIFVSHPAFALTPRRFTAPTRKLDRRLTAGRASNIFSHNMVREENAGAGELIQGTLEMLILKALARRPQHGYAVVEWIQQTSQQVLKVEEGALYPALHRLELRGLLSAKWGASENNRRAKFYQLTAEGKKRLNTESQRWAKLSAAVAFVMQAS